MSDSPTANITAGLPYGGDDNEDLGGQDWYRRPGPVIGLVLLVVALGVVAFLLLSGGDDDAPTPDTTVATTRPTIATTTTEPPTTTSTTTTTTTTTEPASDLVPGLPCDPAEGSPDCIDPEGDGTYVYLLDGDECIANSTDPALCIDSNNDGVAGAGGEGD